MKEEKKKKIIKAWIIVWQKNEYPDCLYFRKKDALKNAKKESVKWDIKTNVIQIAIKL